MRFSPICILHEISPQRLTLNAKIGSRSFMPGQVKCKALEVETNSTSDVTRVCARVALRCRDMSFSAARQLRAALNLVADSA